MKTPAHRACPEQASAPARLGPLAELRHFLGSWVADLRRERLWLHVSDAEAARQITAEAAAAVQALGQQAYTAEQADREAERIISAALADGLTNADLPAVRLALRHIRRSAGHDHALAEKSAALV